MAVKWYICGAYNPQSGAVGMLWLVTTTPNDYFQSGDSQVVNGKDYLLGKREISGGGEVVWYELIKRDEVLEI